LQSDTEFGNGDTGLSEGLETLADVLVLNIDTVESLLVDLLVQVNERQVRLGGDVDLSTHALVVGYAHLSDEIVAATHVELEGGANLIGGVHLEALEELRRHRDESLFGPCEEPIDRAL